MVVPGTRECIVYLDTSWHRRGHFLNQGFAAEIGSLPVNNSIMHFMIEVFPCAPSGMKITMSSLNFWKNTAQLALLIKMRVPKQWKGQLQCNLEQVHSQTAAGLWDLHW